MSWGHTQGGKAWTISFISFSRAWVDFIGFSLCQIGGLVSQKGTYIGIFSLPFSWVLFYGIYMKFKGPSKNNSKWFDFRRCSSTTQQVMNLLPSLANSEHKGHYPWNKFQRKYLMELNYSSFNDNVGEIDWCLSLRVEVYLCCLKGYSSPDKLSLFGLCLFLAHLMLYSVKLEIRNYSSLFVTSPA